MSAFKLTTFHGPIEGFYDFIQAFEGRLDELGLKWTIAQVGEPGCLSTPTPHPDLVARVEAGTASEADLNVFQKTKDRAEIFQGDCRKAMVLLMSSLGSVPLQRLEAIRRNPPAGAETARVLMALLMSTLRQLFGSWSHENEELIKTKIEKIPYATTTTQVEQLSYRLLHINNELESLRKNSLPVAIADCTFSDATLKTKLHFRMHCPALIDLFETFQDPANSAWTYQDCLVKIYTKIDRMNRSFTAKQLTSQSSTLESLASFPQAPTAEPFTAAALAPRGTPTSNIKGAMSRLGNPTFDSQKSGGWPTGGGLGTCFYCGNPGHKVRECQSPICRNCSKFFTSRADPLYHNAADCPQRPPRLQKRHPPFGNHHQQQGNKRTNAACFNPGTYDARHYAPPPARNVYEEEEEEREEAFSSTGQDFYEQEESSQD